MFEQQESEVYPIPFGMGIVLEHNKGELVKFLWMGNSVNNDKGSWGGNHVGFKRMKRNFIISRNHFTRNTQQTQEKIQRKS